ncbi:hypothetical protein GGS23DRAFT_576587 [Durotheca rogersii]|uniref:uncharacterized protein n=1 Tax=Durotheca rogersii TaxID=419775 RepID=UPI00221FD5B3|nr:uncharacterized protein GGS23DRAFT_576587 [Durotheca rogersii]KAI5861389.1 hypothetical protein GGS23DRAFT_576587 [Durotheca rogersii]
MPDFAQFFLNVYLGSAFHGSPAYDQLLLELRTGHICLSKLPLQFLLPFFVLLGLLSGDVKYRLLVLLITRFDGFLVILALILNSLFFVPKLKSLRCYLFLHDPNVLTGLCCC